jgi:hypothetical protein
MQHTVPYTPRQNGVVERKNHTLQEIANYMIQSNILSLKYLVKYINYEKYKLNHTLTKDLKNIITLEESWNNINPNVIHFRVFGSVAWAHIPDEKMKALQPKSGSVFLLVILKMSKVTDFFNLIQIKLLFEEMLNLMKISWPASLIRHFFLLRLLQNISPAGK